MADYRILDTILRPNASQRLVRGLIFMDVPNGTNSAGVQWSVVASEFAQSRGDFDRWPLSAQEQTDVSNGDVFVDLFNTKIDAGLSGQQALNAIEAFLVAEETAIRNQLADRLQYWGRTGSTV